MKILIVSSSLVCFFFLVSCQEKENNNPTVRTDEAQVGFSNDLTQGGGVDSFASGEPEEEIISSSSLGTPSDTSSVSSPGTSASNSGTRGEGEVMLLSGDPKEVSWDDNYDEVFVSSFINPNVNLYEDCKSSTFLDSYTCKGEKRKKYNYEVEGKEKAFFYCPGDSILVGLESFYDSSLLGTYWNDRKYKVVCQFLKDGMGRNIRRSQEDDCTVIEGTYTTNPAGANYNYECPADKPFLSGHRAEFVDYLKPRKHYFACCSAQTHDGDEVTFPQFNLFDYTDSEILNIVDDKSLLKNCDEFPMSSYQRYPDVQNFCSINTSISKISIFIPKEESFQAYGEEFEAKGLDGVVTSTCCEIGIQKDRNSFIYSFKSNQESPLSYELFSKEFILQELQQYQQ